MRSRLCVLAACVFAAGCGGAGKTAKKPITGPAEEAAAVVDRLEKATASRDFRTICDQLLAASTRRQAGGADCAAVLRERAAGVRRPRIVIEGIELEGARAQVRVRTTATGQAATSDVIQLVRERGRFRVLSLGR